MVHCAPFLLRNVVGLVGGSRCCVVFGVGVGVGTWFAYVVACALVCGVAGC